VRDNADIHGYDKRIESILRRIDKSAIYEDDKIKLLEFYRWSLAQGLSKARISKYLDTLERILQTLDKPLLEANKSDIEDFVRKIESKDYSEWTKHDYKVILKIFYKWLRGSEDYPEEVRWIRARVKNNHMLPEEVLTEEDIKRLVNAATNLRDKAFILTLYESGCRIGEFLPLKLKNIQFDTYGALLIVNGKTGMRRVRIVASAPKLALWIDNHPMRDRPEMPLWISHGPKNRFKQLSYSAMKSMLKKVAKRAGIQKRVYPHLFRHSRATYLANHLTESQLKQFLGWVQASKMASIYVHLSGRDVDNALLKLQGIEVGNHKDDSELKLIGCKKCGKQNSPTSKFCNTCGAPLSPKVAIQVDDTRKKVDRLMTALIKRPEVLDSLLNAVEQVSE
jgi:integrase/recombinase XerD